MHSRPSPAGSPKRLALLGCLLASGCYLGSARNTSLADLGGDKNWEMLEGVREVHQVDREDCGAAALAMVLGYWGLPITRDAIEAAMPPAGGIRADDLRNFARRRGMQAFLIRGQLDDFQRELQLRRPVLVGLMKRHPWRFYPHYEVVVGINRAKQRILTLDPAHGLRLNSSEGFTAEWAKAGYLTLIVFRQDQPVPQPSFHATQVTPLPPIRGSSPSN